MKILGFLLVVLLVGYGSYTLAYPSGTFRYKLTLVVDDNGKRIESSSVREVHIQVNPRITPEMNNSVSVKGEAVVIDLGERGVLFAVLRNEITDDYGYSIIFHAFPDIGGSTPEGIKNYTTLKLKRQLPFEMLPMLVRFRDINNQMTIEKVDPYNLEASFGKGVRLLGAIISTTHDSVTWGVVEKMLPWYGKWRTYGGTITGKFYGNMHSVEEIAIPRDFITE